ncbi:hypothetical protein J4G43_053095 (plasmid) [Bradyrhizobium barranii subsp. barranii]|uniref:Uncharacterized protein n=2 Tax=Bradyrhizobium TaxID=374 RepID=A0A939MKN7_9BRAD|nr:hypothetical protein [Bradyrhizobium barranii]UEM17960.1 hypothetical protein J4G43_053095 [Bradyrhizobium barranii subsp. barranii]
MRDIIQNLGFTPTIVPAVQAATINGTSVDTNGFESAALVINTGAIVGAASFSAKLQDSSDGTNFTDVPATLLVGALPGALAANSAYKQGYLGAIQRSRRSIS